MKTDVLIVGGGPGGSSAAMFLAREGLKPVIVEAEKNNRDIVKRGYRRLVTDRDNVSLIVNKVRSYAPKRLELEET